MNSLEAFMMGFDCAGGNGVSVSTMIEMYYQRGILQYRMVNQSRATQWGVIASHYLWDVEFNFINHSEVQRFFGCKITPNEFHDKYVGYGECESGVFSGWKFENVTPIMGQYKLTSPEGDEMFFKTEAMLMKFLGYSSRGSVYHALNTPKMKRGKWKDYELEKVDER